MPIVLPPESPDQAGWEEFYGHDYPYNWLTQGQALDVPVLQNQLCRVRYDPGNAAGVAIDAWDTTSADTPAGGWVEQGKITLIRNGDAGFVRPQLVSASLAAWTPDRAVAQAVMAAGTADGYSRERVLITLQRGWTGPRFEVYASPKSDGTPPILGLAYTVTDADANDSAMKIDATTAAIAATAGSGSSVFTPGGVGAGTFTGENQVAVLRQAAGLQANLAVVQASAGAEVGHDTTAYGVDRNIVEVFASTGYLSVHVGFCPQATDQVIEAEAIRAVSGTTSQVADSTASAGQMVQETQVSDANYSLFKIVTSLTRAKYRVLARVKTDGSMVGSFFANITGTVGATVTLSATAWTWIDLGDLLAAIDAPSFGIAGWRSSGLTGNVYIDRAELFLLEDRLSVSAGLAGARDLGQSVLYDQRVGPRRVQR